MLVLGVESSCDETAVALYDSSRGLQAHLIHSQIDLHAAYGGVVPELASRDHIKRLMPLLNQLLEQSGQSLSAIDAVAYTSGPGLAGALLTGAMGARALAWGLDVPAIAIHHMEGHLLSPMLEQDAAEPPFVCLLVSGGHSQLIRVDAIGRYEFLGDTLDDAAGEAFDKTAKVLGLPYPGGPHLAKLAESGNPRAYAFPRPMTDRPGLDMSFSGLKTAVIVAWRQVCEASLDAPDLQSSKADLAASFQSAIVDTLRIKCQRALQQEGLNHLVVSGGVSANRHLRAVFDQKLTTLEVRGRAVEIDYPSLEFCTDNAAMIALVGALRLDSQGGVSDDRGSLEVEIRPRWPISELQPSVMPC